MIRYILLTTIIIISLIGTSGDDIEVPQIITLYITALSLFFILSKVVIMNG